MVSAEELVKQMDRVAKDEEKDLEKSKKEKQAEKKKRGKPN